MEINAISFAVDTTKEFIAFSTAILTLTATFAKDTFLAKSKSPPTALRVSWILYLAAVFFGIWTLMALTGEVGSTSGDEPSIYGSNVKIPASLMALSFIAALISTTAAAWSAVSRLTRSKGEAVEGGAKEQVREVDDGSDQQSEESDQVSGVSDQHSGEEGGKSS